MASLVSVVITTYNGLDTIERAVQSVLSQTYKSLEIIVVDDNGLGTDVQIKTENIIKNLNSDIIYIPHETNQNGSVARNTGIRAAKGKFVALLDDDDSFRTDKIEKQVAVLESKGEAYGLCYTGMLIHFQNGKEKVQSQTDEGELFELVMQRKIHAQTSSLLFRKDAALKINGFDETFKRHQDWEFLDRMSSQFMIAVVPDVCIDRYIYKRTAAGNPKQFEENRIYYLDKMALYLNQLPENVKNEVYSFHYRSICKEYLKKKNILKALQYFVKCGNPIVTLFNLQADYQNSSLVNLHAPQAAHHHIGK